MPKPAKFSGMFRPHIGQQLRLGARSIYILPTGFGVLWLMAVALLQVVGIQLQSNGALMMSYLLLGLFLLAMHLTAFNLQGLEMSCSAPPPGFADAPLSYPVVVRSRCHRDQLRFEFVAGSSPWQDSLRQGADQEIQPGQALLSIPWQPQQRGQQRPGRLRISSSAPLGLFRCWSLWEPPTAQLVYPARREGPVAERCADAEGNRPNVNGPPSSAGHDHWVDLRPHRAEEGVSRLFWKSLARGRGAHAKVFVGSPPSERLLSLQAGLPKEQAIEHICARICALSAAGDTYGLILGGTTIAPDNGSRHRDQCLMALALLP
ncbi:hypothetical protein [Synechococcus sp. ATX 2A4]|uniref:hypothetical protein n=1 Tax=Synechococcus sp. ATX 2A4 TaxID=2823727 RepID=UPI0020CD520B|nr:hypothetical protein [Synechococcus sp. ATX 2A4]